MDSKSETLYSPFLVDNRYAERSEALRWEDIEQAVRYLVHVMGYNFYKPELIIGISRGGLIPAVMLSHKLNVPVVEAARIQLRDEDPESNANHYRTNTWNLAGDHFNRQQVLVVDDLWDSGATMKVVGKMWPEALRATLFYKSKQKKGKEPNTHYTTLPPINFPGLWLPDDKWAVFPWEPAQSRSPENGRFS